jgi:peroxiredoxin (alkyl hydroperoxide reductase subunit C)
MPAEIGSPAPDFTLPDQSRNPVRLGDLRGRKSLVVFIPFPFTSICSGEICLLRDNLAQLGDLDANVVVITCDTIPVNKHWSEENGFSFPVLSDFWPHGAVAIAYGAFNDKVGAANRQTFVLDEAGTVRAIVASDSLGTPREFDEYVGALASL